MKRNDIVEWYYQTWNSDDEFMYNTIVKGTCGQVKKYIMNAVRDDLRLLSDEEIEIIFCPKKIGDIDESKEHDHLFTWIDTADYHISYLAKAINGLEYIDLTKEVNYETCC